MANQVQTAHPARAKYTRFSPAQRFEHIVLIVTFSGLALTGLPQKYASEIWAQTLINVMGGIESVRIVHRVLAALLMALAIYHGGAVTYKLFVLRRRLTMLPTLRDLTDAVQVLLYNLGLRREHPHLPRYNFGEKFEYWAVVWGTAIMIITGFMLWNPITTSTVLPGDAIPIARLAHGAEAVLAVLSIITWHMYNVHLKRFNRSMFTGKISHEEMEEEHGAELAEIQRGEVDQDPPPDVIAKRQLRFFPYAMFMSIVLVSGLIWFVTFESTSIDTVPRSLRETEITLSVSADAGIAAQGAALWPDLTCQTCHGTNAQGGPGSRDVALAGTLLPFEDFAAAVRRGPADMPAFSQNVLSDQNLADLYAWLASLPNPTAAAQ
jgi:formate dehydrogenase gamma subunit